MDGTFVEGALSVDRRTLLWFKAGAVWTKAGAVWTLDSHWINLPLDVARSVSGRLVFAAAGEAAKTYIVREQGCGSEYPVIDYDQPLRLEVWLGP